MPTNAASPSISVALCTRNGARFVEQQVRSILTQTLPPIEIVLSDDASSDDTVARVEALVSPTGVRLTVFRNDPALGVTKNFEQALSASTGELVALCDQDDVWHPQRLERAAALFAVTPSVLLVSSDARLVDAAGLDLGPTLFETLAISAAEFDAVEGGNEFAALLRRNLITGATTIVRRELVETAVPIPESWVHDEWLASIAAAIGRIGMSREQLVDYRQHGANQIGVRRLDFRGKVLRALEPRGERNARLEARARDLVGRLESWGSAVRPDVIAGARSKLDHERIRNAYPANRLRRIRHVVREVRTGRYELYGRGRGDILRDFVQPAT